MHQTFNADNSDYLPKTKNLAVVALGGNIGDSITILNGAIQKISQTPGIELLQWSSWYRTKPVGGPVQDDYINGCIIIKVNFPPEKLLRTLLGIEDEFGRLRVERWGARTLDLDLIFYEDQIIDHPPTLIVPHPRMQERAFVLVPLTEIAPHWVDPRSGQPVEQLLQSLSPLETASVQKIESYD